MRETSFALRLLGIALAVVVGFFLWVAWELVIEYEIRHNKIRSDMEDVRTLTFEFCYEGSCFYDYEDERRSISVIVNSPGSAAYIAKSVDGLLEDWTNAELLCRESGTSEADGRKYCYLYSSQY